MIGEIRWSTLSAIASVVALFVPILIFFLGRDSKELTVSTVSQSVLVDLSNPMLSSFKFVYKDVPVDKLTVVTIEFHNSGSKPIERTDFDRPINLRFQASSDVLGVMVSEKSPADLNPAFTSDSNGISISPLLLNPGDRFRLAVQLKGYFSEPVVETRISGVRSITHQVYRDGKESRIGQASIAIGFVNFLLYNYWGQSIWVPFFRRRSVAPVPLFPRFLIFLGLGSSSLILIGSGMKMLGIPKELFTSWYTLLTLFGVGLLAAFLGRSKARLSSETGS